jgi:hypothetical protein
MTWFELIDLVQEKLTTEQLHTDVTIYCESSDEYVPVVELCITNEDDVLDVGHPFLVINF